MPQEVINDNVFNSKFSYNSFHISNSTDFCAENPTLQMLVTRRVTSIRMRVAQLFLTKTEPFQRYFVPVEMFFRCVRN